MNWAGLAHFVMSCEMLGVEPPAAAVRGMQQMRIADEHSQDPVVRILDLSEDQIRDHVTALSVRRHHGETDWMRGMQEGVQEVRRLLEAEIREASLPELQRITDDLRSRFEAQAAPFVVAARTYGWTYATTSDDVLLMADEKASSAWRAVREAWEVVRPIAEFRVLMSRTFTAAPTSHVGQYTPANGPLDFTVCFAAGDSWSIDGRNYIEQDMLGDVDWFAVAREGLTLNSPDEVLAKQKARRVYHPRLIAPQEA